MKITLLDNVGGIGIITDYKKVISTDKITFECDFDGTLMVGQRANKVQDGRTSFPEYELMQGPNQIFFVKNGKEQFDCGKINRSGRFINIEYNINKIIVDIATAYNRQAKEIEALKRQLDEIESGRSIKIV